MKSILTVALAAMAAISTHAGPAGINLNCPDSGATALLAAISFGGLVLVKNAMKKR